jgi:hypothetical protein
MASDKDYLRMSGYIIFRYGKPNTILKSYPDEFRFLIKTQKMLKYESPSWLGGSLSIATSRIYNLLTFW